MLMDLKISNFDNSNDDFENFVVVNYKTILLGQKNKTEKVYRYTLTCASTQILVKPCYYVNQRRTTKSEGHMLK